MLFGNALWVSDEALQLFHEATAASKLLLEVETWG